MIAHILHMLSIENAPRTKIRLERMEALMISNIEKLKVQINVITNILSKLQNNSVEGNTNLVRSKSSSRTYTSMAVVGLQQVGTSTTMNPTQHIVHI